MLRLEFHSADAGARHALITGGAGFIGSHLTEHLLDLGWDVTVLDNLSTGRRDNLAAALVRPHGATLVVGCITDEALVSRLMQGVDVVFHLAAAVGVLTIQNDTLASLRTNLHGTQCVLTAAMRAGAKFVFASTSEVYGKNTADGLAEDADRILGSPLLSRWSYAEAKALDETITQQHHLHLGMETVIVRPFNTSGPRQTGRYGMVLPRFARQALSARPITVYGDGEQTRCFTHVHDVVRALGTLATTPAAVGGVFNIGGSEAISINDLARVVLERTGSRSEIVHVDYLAAYGEGFEDMRRRVPDCTRLANLIGWETEHTLMDTIDSVISFERQRLQQAEVVGVR